MEYRPLLMQVFPFFIIHHHKVAQGKKWWSKHSKGRRDLEKWASKATFKADSGHVAASVPG